MAFSRQLQKPQIHPTYTVLYKNCGSKSKNQVEFKLVAQVDLCHSAVCLNPGLLGKVLFMRLVKYALICTFLD